MGGLDWIKWGALAQWVAAFGQISTAIVAGYIAFLTFRYTRNSARGNANKYLIELVNDWNKLIIQHPDSIKLVNEMRPPIQGQPIDSIVLVYLNYLHANYIMCEQALISKEQEQEALKNGAMWFYRMGRENLSQYLSRGYDQAFRNRVLQTFDSLPR